MSDIIRVNFSIQPNDPALEIIRQVDNKSAFIRDACLFKAKYQNEPIEIALHWYYQSESLTEMLSNIIDAKLDELASKLAAKGINAIQEIDEVRSDKIKVDNILSQFDL